MSKKKTVKEVQCNWKEEEKFLIEQLDGQRTISQTRWEEVIRLSSVVKTKDHCIEVMKSKLAELRDFLVSIGYSHGVTGSRYCPTTKEIDDTINFESNFHRFNCNCNK